MTGDATVGLNRSVFINKRSLLVRMTLDTSCIEARCESRLLEFETAVRIVAGAALHRSFQHFVMKRQIELVLGLAMTTEAKLRFACLEQTQIREARLLGVCCRYKHVRSGQLPARCRRVTRVAVGTTDVVAPMLATPEVVVLFSSGMTAQARFGDLLRRFVFERDDLGGIAFFDVFLAWTMTGLTTRHLVFPTLQRAELGVRRRREVFELLFMTVFARVTADVAIVVRRGLGRDKA